MKTFSAIRNPGYLGIHVRLLLTALFIFVLLLALLAYVNTGSLDLMLNIGGIIREGKIILLGIICAVYYVYFLTRYFDHIYQDNLLAIQRYVYELLMVVAGGFLINYTFHYLFVKLVVVPEEDQEALNTKLNNLLMVNQTMMVIVYGVIAAYKTIGNIRQKEAEIARIQKEMLHSQFEALKNQLNPHFLFNSLSVLTSLVHFDADRAEQFIDRLSKTYRYLLDQREKELVPLAEELDFLHNFCFLLEQRYDQKLQIGIQDPDDQAGFYLVPHSLLIIMEYIIANNSMSASQPLTVEVFQRDNELLIGYRPARRKAGGLKVHVQWEELEKSYVRLGKKIGLETDSVSHEATYHIPLFTAHD